ncbi:uncharacterized protein TRIADDRAFT_56229 [Trichoplax adhaerens]|uniref:Uncharacterized protein n=1 Tax=Trichoplax adhaerens TaxID=10228 RepID=B3RXJ2_TRIAD|nr:hypothetical protein TRIADDRAFT_56229 [Trichoplax adhaerens]EDV24868.1 hypothetical protein TRIADDRAFT_56229 [Trichoplax adhaerens]|eukprot:XP_002112758.1 hypothetical protein TRIADDRAFT_56229 [Trichoplax adhaerens]
MSSAYNLVNSSKLKLKGASGKHKKKKRKMHQKSSAVSDNTKETLDTVGKWWAVQKLEQIKGCVSIEMKDQRYLFAMDNGSFKLGDPRPSGPVAEEVFTAVNLSERRIALKSGYGKYVSVRKEGNIVGRADAIGPLEHLEPVIDGTKCGLQAFNENFLGVHEDDMIAALNRTIGDAENLKIRTNTERETGVKKAKQDESLGGVVNCELNYVKMYQSFGDHKLRLNTDNPGTLKKARKTGSFHEELLDRREKMKADRYCK